MNQGKWVQSVNGFEYIVEGKVVSKVDDAVILNDIASAVPLYMGEHDYSTGDAEVYIGNKNANNTLLNYKDASVILQNVNYSSVTLFDDNIFLYKQFPNLTVLGIYDERTHQIEKDLMVCDDLYRLTKNSDSMNADFFCRLKDGVYSLVIANKKQDELGRYYEFTYIPISAYPLTVKDGELFEARPDGTLNGPIVDFKLVG